MSRRLTIAQIKQILATEPALLNLGVLAGDSRRGVQKLLESHYLRQDRLAREEERWHKFRRHEQECWDAGYFQAAGLDEAGRGPLAGPVVAAAVILPHRFYLPGMKDSKQLSAARRQEYTAQIKKEAVAWAVGTATVAEIDALNILRASLLAMERAWRQLSVPPDILLIDGRISLPGTELPQRPIVAGDAKAACIAAASIIAKTHRDEIMCRYAKKYPEYGFEQHAGYPTGRHRDILRRIGPCPLHRRTFLKFLNGPDAGLFDTVTAGN
jgi:ribonuclease HII